MNSQPRAHSASEHERLARFAQEARHASIGRFDGSSAWHEITITAAPLTSPSKRRDEAERASTSVF